MDNALKWWLSAAARTMHFQFISLVSATPTGDGVEKDPSQAYEWFERAVALEEHGSDEARFCLGFCQYYGSGCEEDDDAAYINFSLAHEAGVERAAYYVGACNYWGQGTSKNYIEAAEHFEECAESDPDAAFYLGECHRNGTGRKKDYKQAFEWYLKSAEGEVDNAQMAIGRAFYLGEGVAEDNVEAVKWLDLAAEQENAEAQYYLGECHLKGFGVAENLERGIELLRASAAQGNTDAITMLHENGFELEEGLQSEAAQKTGPVIEVFGEFDPELHVILQNITEQ